MLINQVKIDNCVPKMCKVDNNQCKNLTPICEAIPNEQSELFKLNIDCLEELFEFLSLKDLHCLGQTCKRMQQIVGVYFRDNFSALDLRCKHDGVYLDCCRNGCKVHGLNGFIQKLSIRTFGVAEDFEKGLKMFRYAGANCNKFLKKIQFGFVRLTGRDIDCIAEILSNVETVAIEMCRMNSKFYEKFPNICSKQLKRLYVSNFECNRNVLRRTGNEWLLRRWPNLVHLGWTQSHNEHKINEIKTFFELNPNVRSFSTDLDCLWASRHLIFESNVKLDELTVEIFDWDQPTGNYTNEFFNELYDRGVYKRLHLQSAFYDGQHRHLMELGSVRGLEVLRHLNLVDGMNFPKLVFLKELRTSFASNSHHADILAKNLTNLERLHMRYASIEHLLPFIYYSAKLKEAKIDVVGNKEDFKCVLDLVAMNNERRKLPHARKVTIYIEEKVYLATKWGNYTTNLGLVQIKRAHSHEWSNHFEYY